MSQTDLFNESFAHSYRVCVNPELFSDERAMEFPPDGPSRPASILVRVHPQGGAAWLGLFKGGDLSHTGKTGVYSWPNADVLCVVCAGTGCVVEAADPSRWRELDAKIVVDLLPLRDRGIVVVADPWQLWAYDADGLRWQTGRIALDGLRVTGRNGDRLYGVAESFGDEEVPFCVDLTTGNVEGGMTFG